VPVLKAVFREFMNDDSPRSAAALAYYTIFALPPLLVLILMVTGVFVDPQDVQGSIEQQMRSMIGPDAASAVRGMVESAARDDNTGLLATLLSVGALAFGATGAFVQLQTALNSAWEVAPDPEQGGLRAFVMKRVFSFGMIMALAFLMLVSLTISAVLSAFGEQLASLLPGGLSDVTLRVLDFALSLAIITLLFAGIFKVLPDAVIAWRDVWVGAAVTGALFVVGKYLIGFYIGRSEPGSAYGAAGSLAVILIWIYYTAMIVLLGAEFTQVWARRRGGGIRPEEGAVRIIDGKPARTRPGARTHIARDQHATA
jgi:membrane protein